MSIGPNVIILSANGKQAAALHIIRSDAVGDEPAKGYKNYFLHPKEDYAADCIGCHPVGESGQPAYSRLKQKTSCTSASCHNDKGKAKNQHGPMAEGSCVECHNPHGTTNSRMLRAVRAELCYRCHDDLEAEFDRKFQHFPVKKGECLSCHEPHESDLEFHLKRGSIKELCAGCHGTRLTDFPNLHEPVKEGDCIACHNPHVSDFAGLLYEDGNKMCFRCHEVREKEFAREHVHEPLKKGCVICHDPHGSVAGNHLRTELDENGRYIPGQSMKDSCLVCHRKLNPLIADEMENAIVPHKPVAEGKCLVCHTPHSTNYKKQLNRPLKEICFSCHEGMKKLLAESKVQHGPIRKSSCEQCHLVHGAGYGKLLAARFDTTFFGDFAVAKYQLCFNCHSSKVFTARESMETGFRYADLNLHFFHVNRDNGRGCKTCHDIHASNQDKHIRESTLFKKKYKVKIKYTSLENGGKCVVGCHKPRQYDREKKIMG
ncbi:MAG: hypothetical protein KKG47_14930 [Proteobacteria bacterium]|nr:hypothetical protein [Pseudomonadota bacterium]MBU1738834.1 hypothetical protein [Pseudomonadota bacterium]